MDKMPKRKRNTKASRTFYEVVYMHPHATWALDVEMEMMVEDASKPTAATWLPWKITSL
jgi:hypothetical protein